MAGFAAAALLCCAAASYLSVIGRRKKTMFERVKNFISAFHLPTAAELEREYLNGAGNRVDLEFRQRLIDRGMFRRFDG
jgi:hypothetical protein